MIRVGFRPSPLVNVLPKRATLVGCDFPLCEKALEFPVNLQATDTQCKNDTIRYLRRAKPHGWHTDGRKFYCQAHAPKTGG
jgi:hypothetical protein